jgi:hypothetical protein
VEKKKKSGSNILSSAKDGRPEAVSNIAGNAANLEPHPTEEEQEHLHPKHQKGQET